MQKGPLRPMMTGCILYLMLIAILFLLSGFLFFQIAFIALLVIIALVCAWLAGKETVSLPRLLSSRAFCIGSLIPIVLAAVGVFFVMHNYRALQVKEETTVSVSGIVERVHYATDSGASFILDLDQINGRKCGGKICVQSTGQAYYANEGERILCTVVLGVEEQVDAYEENKLYAFPDGIYAYAEIRDSVDRLGTVFSFQGVCDRIAAWCKQCFYQYLPQEAAELSIGILLGDKTVLSPDVKRDFRRVGASHILAVSGMHISILISGLLYAMRKLGIGMRKRYAVALLFIFIYMGVIGFSPSVVRAGVMWMLVCIAHLIHEQTDALTSLFTAAALLCFFSPGAVFDIGFLLSVSASCGLILLVPPMKSWMVQIPFMKSPYSKPLRSVIEITATTLAASIFTMPITFLVFGELSLIAPIANLLLHVPVLVLLYIAPLLLLLAPITFLPPAEWIVQFLSGVLSGDAALISDLVGWLSRAKHIMIGVRYVFTAVLLVGFILGFLCMYHRTRSLLIAFPVYGTFILVLFISLQIHAYIIRGDVAVTYDVDRKNDIVSVVTDGRGLMIDASDGSYAIAGDAWKQLSKQNITELDVYLLTHYHTRHISSIAKLIQNTVVKTLVLPIPQTEEEKAVCASVQELAVNAGIGVQMYRRGEDDILFGDAMISCFPKAMLDRSVQPVLGWTISAHDETIAYFGGAAFETVDEEPFSLRRDSVLAKCDVILLGVHGPLYKAAFPPLSQILSEGTVLICANNEISTLLHEEDRSAQPIYTVEEDGAVRVILDGN